MKLFSRGTSHTVFGLLASSVAFTGAFAHEPLEWNGDKIHVILDDETTKGSVGMFTVETGGPVGPPRHIHEDADEAFYILEGEAEILVDDEILVIGEGEGGFAPSGTIHTFRMTRESGGKILVVVTPGGFEGFFNATSNLKLPDQMSELEEISKKFGQVFAGPPLGKE